MEAEEFEVLWNGASGTFMYDRDGTIWPIRYLSDTINMYMTFGFKNFGFQQQSECFGVIICIGMA